MAPLSGVVGAPMVPQSVVSFSFLQRLRYTDIDLCEVHNRHDRFVANATDLLTGTWQPHNATRSKEPVSHTVRNLQRHQTKVTPFRSAGIAATDQSNAHSDDKSKKNLCFYVDDVERGSIRN